MLNRINRNGPSISNTFLSPRFSLLEFVISVNVATSLFVKYSKTRNDRSVQWVWNNKPERRLHSSSWQTPTSLFFQHPVHGSVQRSGNADHEELVRGRIFTRAYVDAKFLSPFRRQISPLVSSLSEFEETSKYGKLILQNTYFKDI